MAVKNVLFGEDAFVYDGTTLIGCLKNFKVTSSTKEIDVTCTGSGQVEQVQLGKSSYKWDCELFHRYATTGAEDSSNITAWDFISKYQAKTEITLVMKGSGTLTAGMETYTGIGFISSISLAGNDGDAMSFNASGSFNSFTPTRVTPV